MKLTPEQAKVLNAVLSRDCDTLVCAPPGAGKTTLALLCAREYAKQLQPLQRVFFLTFSNSAVDAITSRRRSILTGLNGAKVEVTNFHQFTLAILRSYGPAVGLGLPIRIIDGITERYLERQAAADLLRQGYLPFDRFVPLANDVFARNSTLREAFASKYPLVIVDEFQDTAPAQWDFVKNIAAGGRLLCLADPNQMIYEFTGASLKRFDEFCEARPRHVRIDIGEDSVLHRFTTPQILEVANCLRRDESLPKWIIDPKQPVHLEVFYNKNQAKAQLLTFIFEGERQGCSSTAILCRTNRMAEMVSRWLSDASVGGKLARKVPHYYHLPEGISEAIIGILRAVGNVVDAAVSGDISQFGTGLQWWALIPRTRSKTSKAAKTAEDRVWSVAMQAIDGKVLKRTYGKLWGEVRAAAKDGVSLDELIGLAYSKMLSLEYALRFARTLHAEYGAQIVSSLGRLGRAVYDSPHTPASEHADSITSQMQAERSHGRNRRITIMTMHQSKGREYDAVAVVYPAYRRREEDDQERRVFYTAVTRARRRVLLLVQQEVKAK